MGGELGSILPLLRAELGCLDQALLGHASAQAVESNDNNDVTLSGVSKKGIKAGTVALGSRHDVFEDAAYACTLQSVTLLVSGLFRGAHSGVPD